MPDPISIEWLAEIQACERETRDGPWILADANDGDGTVPMWVVATSEAENEDCDWAVHLHVGDKQVGEFIVMARTAVPELLAEVDRLTAELAKAQRTPRCGAMTPSAFINANALGPCILDHGHGGMHEEASPVEWPGHPVARWTERNDPLAVANARIRELEAGIDRVMKMPMHAHDGHWCSSSRDVIRALGDVAPAPTAEAVASLLSGMAERAAGPTAAGGPA